MLLGLRDHAGVRELSEHVLRLSRERCVGVIPGERRGDDLEDRDEVELLGKVLQAILELVAQDTSLLKEGLVSVHGVPDRLGRVDVAGDVEPGVHRGSYL